MSHIHSGFWTSQNDLLAAAGLYGLPGEPVQLNRAHVIDPNGDAVWFPLNAVFRVEVGPSRLFGGLIDCHGAVGLTNIFQRSTQPYVWVVEVPGFAFVAAKAHVEVMLERSARFSRAVIAWLSESTAEAQELAAFNVEQTALERVSRLIRNLHRAHQAPERLAISQSEIAQLTGIQRTTVCNVMMRLKTMNLIDYSRTKISIMDPDALGVAA